MPDKMLYVLAQFDRETQSKMNHIQQLLKEQGISGQQTSNLLYHLTLASFDSNQESEIKERLQTVCHETSSFNLTLSHIGLFGLTVLFLAPNVTHDLLDLQSHFIQGNRDEHEWAAHATLLIDESEAVQKALPIVAEHFKPFRATIDSISLYEFRPARCIENQYLR
ncbi:MAG: 2'-5' RNA ligase family protein [Sporolactobacillus sp.]